VVNTAQRRVTHVIIGDVDLDWSCCYIHC